MGVTIIWWRMWLYNEWLGSPKILPKVWGLNGEDVYDAVMLEMLILCLIAVTIVYIGLKLVINWTRNH